VEWAKNGGKDLLDRAVNEAVRKAGLTEANAKTVVYEAVRKVGLTENEPLAKALPGNLPIYTTHHTLPLHRCSSYTPYTIHHTLLLHR
jgi:hypothetical protein